MNLSKISYDLTAVTMGIHALERQRNDGNSLLDGEGLVWASVQAEYQVLRSATVYAGLRELEADFDADEGSVTIDDGWFLGLQLDL